MKKLIFLILLLIPSLAFALTKDECVHPNGQLYKDHWNACKLTLYQWQLRGQDCEAQLISQKCDIFTDWNYPGPGDQFASLWKPVQEGRAAPYPALLLKGDFYLPAKVEIYHPSGYVVAQGFSRGELQNGGFATFDINELARDLPLDAFVAITVPGQDVTECKLLPNPTLRYER